jgi:hypothetical protein
MKNFLKINIITLFGGVFVSCAANTVYLTSSYLDRSLKKTTRLTHEKIDKTVILVPMAHIGKEKAYSEIHTYLDSLKADGFVTFCEGAAQFPLHIDTIADVTTPLLFAIRDSVKNLPDSARNSLDMQLDTLRRKSRFIVGFDVGTYLDQYLEKVNKKGKKQKYYSQARVDLGLTTEKDIWVDYTVADLVGLYEKEYGPVPLTEYDFATPFDQPYKQKSKADDWSYTTKYRNRLLERRIRTSPHQKIVVVYGGAHTRWMKLGLRYPSKYYEDDDRYVIDKKYDARKRIESKQ